jgi:uncharacterized membrane protein SirB2
MNWYLIVKYLHILAVAITIGGMFARQLVRGFAKRSDDITMVIPWSNLIFLMGIILALMQQWPVFGFLQGATQNWLLVSNVLLIIMLALIPTVFIPHNKKVESLLQTALAKGHITPELSAALNDKRNQRAHQAEEIIILVIAALMVLKPF